MSKLDLDPYTDKQIVEALFKMKVSKFMIVMGALAKILDEMKARGEEIADKEEDVVENMIRQLFEGEE